MGITTPRDPENNWGPEFNYLILRRKLDTYPARWFMATVNSECHIDGIRFGWRDKLLNPVISCTGLFRSQKTG